MGTNLQYKGLQEVLSSIGGETEDVSAQEVTSEWKRLASFMGNIK